MPLVANKHMDGCGCKQLTILSSPRSTLLPASIASFMSIFNALHAELDAYSGNFCLKLLSTLSASIDRFKSNRQRANLHTCTNNELY
ncbi:hypothetical protein ALC57_11124 [Trachymyrmex cornetzi]|uniref:Uncharacterized protein n=1 Tax=Trachymyrmex cornetzi TaxID=471704 RepID=A0A195DUN2_9HYME|nr:hypothetical protein ALC57_11124 [Trachymyrmex cornetzi]